MPLVISPLHDFPMIEPGDGIAPAILDCMNKTGVAMNDGDVFVITQKVISKAENRYYFLDQVTPSPQALELALDTDKDPRLVELILRESNEVVRKRKNTLIVEHKLGFVCAGAGIDQSNITSIAGRERVLLLPTDPDRSARMIRKELMDATDKQIGIMVIDTQGRAWRNGVVGMCIGLSGLPALVDKRGKNDLFGNTLQITVIGVADELAAAASLMMGQAAEGTPVVHVRGFPYPLEEGNFNDILRSKDVDLFR